MPILRSTFLIVSGLAGAIVTGQAPEFAQQYRQRLGGALEELRAIVAQFDRDAAGFGLTRDDALARYDTALDDFLKERGTSMRIVLERHRSLEEQAARFAELPPVARPLAMLREPDGTVAQGAWRDFEPALPLTTHGLAWSAAGFAVAFSVAAALARVLRFRPSRRTQVPKAR